ncbi:MAG: hypothetical protein GY953_01725, partial [bacterium]|nr:hypothetical protein [bacterium]
MLDSLSHLYLPGAVTMWCAVFFGLAALWGYSQAVRQEPGALTFARRGYLFFTAATLLGALVLLSCLM